jgi:long-chain acyl-CoA synthetase
MEEWPQRPAMVWRDQPFSYGSLLETVALWKRHLATSELRPGQVVALEGDFSPQAVGLLLALIDGQAIVVPLTKAMEAHRTEFMEVAEVEVRVTFDTADAWHIERRGSAVRNPITRQVIDRGHPGLVLFSSGSTGKNKAALHDFTALLEKFRVLRTGMCTLTFLLLDHIGGINTLFYTLSNGGTVVAVPSRDPEVVCRAIERHRVELLPTSPTFLNLLLISDAYKHHDLSSLKRITYGTEVMPETTLRRIHELLPAVELQQTYGLSELGILRSKSKDSSSLWVKVGGEGFETKVVNGVLWIRAESAMVGYLNAPSPFDEHGWMNTEDVVEVDGDYIRIRGRRTEIINVGGEKAYPTEIEDVLMQMENIRDATVYGEKNPITGHIVVAKVNVFAPEPLMSLKNRIRAFCRDKLAPYKIPIKIEITEDEQFSARYKKARALASGRPPPDQPRP